MKYRSRGGIRLVAAPGFILLTVAALLAVGLQAQTAPQSTQAPVPRTATPGLPPAERPGDVYKELMRPLDQVRSSLDNWSPAELAALAAGVARAQEYCKQVPPTSVTGDDLYQLARVCSIGVQWSAADTAANLYIKSGSAPYQAHAYAIRVNALLNLRDTAMAIEVARSMLHSLPYDATVDQSLAYLIHYLAMSLDDAALPLAQERQPFLLAVLQSGNGLKEQPGDTVIGMAALYSEGLELAYLEQYASRQNEAQQAVAALDAALAKVPLEKIDNPAEIARAKLQYALLGQKLPDIKILRYVTSMDVRPRINPSFGSATVLFLFPDWCAQCIRMMPAMTEFLRRNGANGTHTYGLLALDAAHADVDPFTQDRFKDLLKTPTLTTPAATLQIFSAVAYPFAVITDGDGRIRFLGTVPANAFDAGGFVEQLLDKTVMKNASADRRPSPAQ